MLLELNKGYLSDTAATPLSFSVVLAAKRLFRNNEREPMIMANAFIRHK
jgi:hypothetical protein